MDETGRMGAPVLHLDEVSLADVELTLDGLLRQAGPLGQQVEARAVDGPAARTALALQTSDREAVLAAGEAVLVDTEATPVAALRRAEADPSVAGGVRGELVDVRPGETGIGRTLRRRGPSDTLPAVPGRPSPAVLLRRPPLPAEIALLAQARRAGSAPLLVVPVAGPTPDGVPAEVLLRTATVVARRHDLPVLTVPAAWRGEPSDTHLVGQLAAGLGAQDVLVLRAAADHDGPEAGTGQTGSGAAGDDSWPALLLALRRGDEQLPISAGAEVTAVLQGWMPPRSSRGLVVLMTGLSGSGKSTLARGLHERLLEDGDRTVSLLDGDVVRRLLSSGLGFDAASRDLNVRRIGYVASEVARHGGVAICAPIAPYERSRAAVRRMVEAVGDLVLVHVSTPLEECERRDLKGLYARARAGLVPAFTGISDPYEEPQDADVVVDTSVVSPAEALDLVLAALRSGGWLPDRRTPAG